MWRGDVVEAVIFELLATETVRKLEHAQRILRGDGLGQNVLAQGLEPLQAVVRYRTDAASTSPAIIAMSSLGPSEESLQETNRCFAERLGHSAKALCPRQSLCRGPHSAKTRRQKIYRQRCLCRGPFFGHSAKTLPRVFVALGKEKWPSRTVHADGDIAERSARRRNNFFKLLIFAECRRLAKKFIFL